MLTGPSFKLLLAVSEDKKRVHKGYSKKVYEKSREGRHPRNCLSEVTKLSFKRKEPNRRFWGVYVAKLVKTLEGLSKEREGKVSLLLKGFMLLENAYLLDVGLLFS